MRRASACGRRSCSRQTTAPGAARAVPRAPTPDDDRRHVSVEVDRDGPTAGAGSRRGCATLSLRAQRLSRPGGVLRPQRCSATRELDAAGSTPGSRWPREALILPAATFADVRRQVVGVAAAPRPAARAAGQHLKRGLLLYGPPGVGKTHTVRYLVGELTGTTVVELTRRHAARDHGGLLDRPLAAAGDDRGRGRRPDRRAARPLRRRDARCCSPCSTRWTASTRTPTWSSCSPPTGPTCSSRRSRRDPAGSTRPCTSTCRTRRPGVA